ncbi:DUF6049 family protein [Marinactinospora thermotolerans]|uniref:DUF6049 family protein n=1 Tax=Marinactinospora thermotolerans TaxID=531310 RepID=UPI003D8F4E14
MRRIVHLGAVMATAVALVPTAFHPVQEASAAVASTVSPASGDSAATAPLIVEEITPRAVGKKSTVTVTGKVTNTTGETLEGVTVRLRYSSYPLTGRDQLESHSAGESTDPQAFGPSLTVKGPLAPGESAPYELKVKTSELGLGGFGVYPLAVESTDAAGERLGVQRTFLPYDDGSDVEPVEVAWVWPLLDRPQRADDDTYLDDTLDASLSADGRLGRLLSIGGQAGGFDESVEEPPADGTADADEDTAAAEKAGGTPAKDDAAEAPRAADSREATTDVPLTWAVDPGLLDDISRIAESGYQVLEDGESDTPRVAPREASENAATWLEQARVLIGEDPLLATPYANPDLAALLGSGLENDAESSVTLGRLTLQQVLGRSADHELAWPAGGAMNDATRDFLADRGAERFLLDDSALPASEWIAHTPTAATSLPLGNGEAGTALAIDGRISEEISADTWEPGQAALAQQRFAAETAMIAAEQPGGERRAVVVAPEHDWDPNPVFAQGLLEATEDLPWLEPVALDEIQADPGAVSEREGPVYSDSAAQAELDGDHLDRIKDIRGEVRLFNSVLTNDGDPFRPAILRLESAAWRDEDEAATRALDRLATSVDETIGKVRVMPGEPVTLASKSGTIGILVANDLEEHSVTVHLSIFSENSERLSIGNYTTSMEIGPGGKTTVYVPISARINGRTVLHMSLQNADGEPISAHETTTPVNVTGLGTTALLISGAGAMVLIVALAPRALRKWARKRREAMSGEGEQDGAPAPGAAAGATEAMHHNVSAPSGQRPDATSGDERGDGVAGRT